MRNQFAVLDAARFSASIAQMRQRVDAAVHADAKTRPQRTWKTASSAVSHTMNYFGKLEAKYRQRLQLAAAKAAPKPLLEIAAAAELPAQAAPVEPSGGGEKSGQ
jgi:hypothetical protein